MRRNHAILKVREALDILATGAERWGSDACACDDCVRLRRRARLDAITALAKALSELSE